MQKSIHNKKEKYLTSKRLVNSIKSNLLAAVGTQNWIIVDVWLFPEALQVWDVDHANVVKTAPATIDVKIT